MKAAYISHSRSDAQNARILAELLATRGVDVAKTEELALAAEWHAEIFSSIRRCSLFVAFIEEGPIPSVMLELGYALGAGKPVVLVSGRETRIPLDIAALPVVRFDEDDRSSMVAMAEEIRRKASADVTPEQQFLGVRDRLECMLTDPDYLDRVSPREFEESVLAFLRELGFDAELMPPNHDGGFDILARDRGTSLLAVVEVKKYQRNAMLGVAPVRQLIGAMTVSDATCAILIATSRFSPSALDVARRAPRRVLLMTLDDLVSSTRESILDACRLLPIGREWLAGGEDSPEWPQVWAHLVERGFEIDQLLPMGRDWLTGRGDTPAWTDVWQRLVELGFDTHELQAIGREWLQGREDTPVWSHVWARLVELGFDTHELQAIGREWLQGREDTPAWPDVWQRLVELGFDTHELQAIGREWLQGREDTPAWSHVWARLVELGFDTHELQAIGRDWLAGREDRPEWGYVWRRLVNVGFETDQLLAIGRDWLAGGEHRTGYQYVYQKLHGRRLAR